jgi:hypothetical protein
MSEVKARVPGGSRLVLWLGVTRAVHRGSGASDKLTFTQRVGEIDTMTPALEQSKSWRVKTIHFFGPTRLVYHWRFRGGQVEV